MSLLCRGQNKIFERGTCSSITPDPPQCHRSTVVGNFLLKTESDACHKMSSPKLCGFRPHLSTQFSKHSLDKRPYVLIVFLNRSGLNNTMFLFEIDTAPFVCVPRSWDAKRQCAFEQMFVAGKWLSDSGPRINTASFSLAVPFRGCDTYKVPGERKYLLCSRWRNNHRAVSVVVPFRGCDSYKVPGQFVGIRLDEGGDNGVAGCLVAVSTEPTLVRQKNGNVEVLVTEEPSFRLKGACLTLLLLLLLLLLGVLV